MQNNRLQSLSILTTWNCKSNESVTVCWGNFQLWFQLSKPQQNKNNVLDRFFAKSRKIENTPTAHTVRNLTQSLKRKRETEVKETE